MRAVWVWSLWISIVAPMGADVTGILSIVSLSLFLSVQSAKWTPDGETAFCAPTLTAHHNEHLHVICKADFLPLSPSLFSSSSQRKQKTFLLLTAFSLPLYKLTVSEVGVSRGVPELCLQSGECIISLSAFQPRGGFEDKSSGLVWQGHDLW